MGTVRKSGYETRMAIALLIQLLAITLCHVFENIESRHVNIALLIREERDVDTVVLQNALSWAQKYVISGRGVTMNILKVVVRPGKVFSNEMIFTKNLSSASFILEPYHVDNSACVLGDLFKIPYISIADRPAIICQNTVSLRPNDEQLYKILNQLINEDKPQSIGVVVEEGLSMTATDIISLSEQNDINIYYQIMATVNFSDRRSISSAAKEAVRASKQKMLLLMRSYHVARFIAEVRKIRNFVDTRWFVPILDVFPNDDLFNLEGLTGLRIPVVSEKYEQVRRQLDNMKTKSEKVFEGYLNVEPMLHDAIVAIAETIKASPMDLTDKTEKECPFKKREELNIITDVLREVQFEGITGPVRFNRIGFRNITELEAKEVSGGTVGLIGVWSETCKLFRWDGTSSYGRRKDQFRACAVAKKIDAFGAIRPRKKHLKVVTIADEPFMFYNESEGTGNDRFTGFCKDLLDKLSDELEFTYDLYLEQSGVYGSCENETETSSCEWSGVIGEIQKKRADIGIGSITITSEREKYVDFSKSFMDFTMTLMMQKPVGQVFDIFAFMEPFEGAVWASIAAVAIVVTVVLFFIDRCSPTGCRALAKKDDSEMTGREFSFTNCLWFATTSILQQGPDYTPRSPAARTLSAAFWFFTLIIISTYTANLAAVFTISAADTGIRSLEDLAKQDRIEYGILGRGGTYSFFKNSQVMLYKHMFAFMKSRNTFAASTASAVERVRNGGFAYLSEDPLLHYKNQRRPCNTVLIRNLLDAKSYGLILPSQSEWTNPISVVILNLREQGYIDRIKSKWWEGRSECGTDMAAKPGKPISLRFSSVAGVYAILAGGILISFLLLLVELKYKNLLAGRFLHKHYDFNKKKQQQKKKTINPDIAYMDYGDADPYDLALQKISNQMNGSDELMSAKSKGYLHPDSPLSERYDPTESYRDAPESTI